MTSIYSLDFVDIEILSFGSLLLILETNYHF